MADISLKQIEQLLDKKLSENQEGTAAKIGQLAKRVDQGFANTATTEQLSALTKRVEEGFANAATIEQIDAVAKHLAEANAHLGEIDATLKHQSESLEAISRRLNSDLDRLDDHGARIKQLEAKTAHLPAPPTSR